MRVVTAFPREVRTIEHCAIPLPDGCRLAARIWLPADADASPVPAVLEYIPYRKRDLTRGRDEPMHHWLAGHGYAAVRVDVRGTGDSEGLLADEYSEAELADGEAVIAWIAAQPWCTGAVGMMGKSWGGFNALQIAARRPPALRAVLSVCASDDRYTDDAHFMGGCLLNENLTWGTALVTLAALPPDPELAGEGWREAWLARVDHTALFPAVWLHHQRRDAYWRRGSVSDDLGAISCPVFAVGGWADAYSNAIPRLLAGLRAPHQGLMGPWGHVYPHTGVPGPAIGFLEEARRWWDRWLLGRDDAPGEPGYRVWMAESRSGTGRWVAEATWPSPRITPRRWTLGDRRLEEHAGREGRLEWRSPETVGLAAGDWCVFSGADDMPGEQAEDDAGSLTFDSKPLDERVEILGAPVLEVELAVDRPQALLAVRLNEVHADGASRRVTYGVLNLTQRRSHESPEPLEPGRRYRVRVVLNDVAHAFASGSRLRVALSTSYWPIVWPSPEPVRLTVFTGAGTFELPVRPPSATDATLRPFAEPEGARGPVMTVLQPTRVQRTTERKASGEVVQVIRSDGGGLGAGGRTRIDAIDLEIEQSGLRSYRIRADDPLSARAEVVERLGFRRGDWAVRVETHVALAATGEAFEIRATLDAFEGEERVRARRFDERVRRDGV
jgi:uncharacterized protein